MNTPAETVTRSALRRIRARRARCRCARAEIAREIENTSRSRRPWRCGSGVWPLWRRRRCGRTASLRLGAYSKRAGVGCAGARRGPTSMWDNISAVAMARNRRRRAAAVLLAIRCHSAADTGADRGRRSGSPRGDSGYMASTIASKTTESTGWTATMDLQHARMVVVPAAPVALAQGRAPQLWLIPAGQKPISVGMITGDKPTTLVLDPGLVGAAGPHRGACGFGRAAGRVAHGSADRPGHRQGGDHRRSRVSPAGVVRA